MGLTALGGVMFARSLGPAKIGVSAIVLSALSFGVVLVNLVQSSALIVEYKAAASEADRASLVAGAAAMRICIALPFAIVAPLVVTFAYSEVDFGMLAWYLAPMVLLQAVNPAWAFQAIEKQGIQAALALCAPVCTVGLCLVALNKSSPVGTDLWITLLSLTVSIAVSWWWLFRGIIPRETGFALQASRRMLRILKDARWLMVAGIAGYAYLSFEEQLIAYLCSASVLGTYRTGKIVADAVNSVLGVSTILLFPRMIEWRSKGELLFRVRVWRIGGLASLLAVAVAVAAAFAFPPAHRLIFGRQFEGAINSGIILLLSKCVVLVSNVFSWSLLSSATNYRVVSLVMLSSCFISLGTNFVFVPRYGMEAAAWTTFACESFNLALYVLLFATEPRRVARHSKC